MNKRLFIVTADVVLLILSFLFVAWLKPATAAVVLPKYLKPFVFFLLLWTITSLATKKYTPDKFQKFREIAKIIVQSNLITLATVATLIYTFKLFIFSRSILYGTILAATFLELILAWIYSSFLNSTVVSLPGPKARTKTKSISDEGFAYTIADQSKSGRNGISARVKRLLNLIESEFGTEVKELISTYTIGLNGKLQVVSTTTKFNIQSLPEEYYDCLINLHRINDIRWLNKFFETINQKLHDNGIFIGRVETKELRKKKILSKYPVGLNYFIYFLDFLFRRVMPKLPLMKKIYFAITRGENRVISRAETLGRLCSCGFSILEEKNIDNHLYFVTRKTGDPLYPEKPTYGILVRLRRIGKDGKEFYVYKMRTMHPFSEYLQQYVYERNSLDPSGKFKEDFRVHTLGRIMRKFWIDELPMLINLIKGDLKLVGVRPLSKHYFDLYSEDLKQLRIRYKPGLIPPYYADLPNSLQEIMESERRYLEAYARNPFKTDVKYFFRAIRNILLKNARSR